MTIDFYTFIHKFFDEHPEDVEVIFFDTQSNTYRGTIWVRRSFGNIQFMPKTKNDFIRWSTLREGEYKVDGLQRPNLVGQPNYRIKVSYIRKTNSWR